MSVTWDLSCVDWAERIRSGKSLIPDLPLYEPWAKLGLEIFDNLRLPDVPGQPLMRNACGDWFREIVYTMFGSALPAESGNFDSNGEPIIVADRVIREIFALVPKGQSKTTYSAGLIVAAMAMNNIRRSEMAYIGPTQAISDRAFEQSVAMIKADRELNRRFHPRLNVKQIHDRLLDSTMRVQTFDVDIVTGSMPNIVLLDEVHLLGANVHAGRVITQIRGGLQKKRDGFLMMITTQSDVPPAGVFKDELHAARAMRDGENIGKDVRMTLPVLYEFPEEIARDEERWSDPANWSMVMPNLGRSMQLDSLVREWESEKVKGDKNRRVWASQHLNIEIGIGLRTDAWPGAKYWNRGLDATIELETLADRCDVLVVGIDGGGLDDLFGLSVVGREKGWTDELSQTFVAWSHAWCHKGVLELRRSMATKLLEFEAANELTIVDDKLTDISEITAIVDLVNGTGKMVCVAVDPAALGELASALARYDITEENKKLVGVPQGFGLMNAIKTTERKLVNGTFKHSKSALMNWCVGNVKIEPTATAIRATKQNAGDAKIDPWAAMIDAVFILSRNPEAPGQSVYQTRGVLVY